MELRGGESRTTKLVICTSLEESDPGRTQPWGKGQVENGMAQGPAMHREGEGGTKVEVTLDQFGWQAVQDSVI